MSILVISLVGYICYDKVESSNGNDILLVGYNNKGYAFYFNSSEEINGFIESLK